MATSLAAQLAQVAANSKSTLNVKAQKAAHSKSLIWEPRVAATQSYQVLYTTCYQGFEELCQLDSRFVQFQSTIFSEESQNEDRTQLTAAENQELDRRVQAFLRLAGSRLRLMPAIKAIEWLIRRFRYVMDVFKPPRSRELTREKNPRGKHWRLAPGFPSLPLYPGFCNPPLDSPNQDTPRVPIP